MHSPEPCAGAPKCSAGVSTNLSATIPSTGPLAAFFTIRPRQCARSKARPAALGCVGSAGIAAGERKSMRFGRRRGRRQRNGQGQLTAIVRQRRWRFRRWTGKLIDSAESPPWEHRGIASEKTRRGGFFQSALTSGLTTATHAQPCQAKAQQRQGSRFRHGIARQGNGVDPEVVAIAPIMTRSPVLVVPR